MKTHKRTAKFGPFTVTVRYPLRNLRDGPSAESDANFLPEAAITIVRPDGKDAIHWRWEIDLTRPVDELWNGIGHALRTSEKQLQEFTDDGERIEMAMRMAGLQPEEAMDDE